MSRDQVIRDDEIHIIDFLGLLWAGRWIIISFVVLTSLIGFGYSQVIQPKYKVSVTYTDNVITLLSGKKICGNKQICMNSPSFGLLDSGWTKSKNSLVLLTTTPLDVSDYEAQIKRANIEITNKIYAAAKDEIALVKSEMTNPQSADGLSIRKLNAKRLILSIDSGKKALNFSSVSVSKISPKVPKILFLSFLLGGVLGVIIILIRNTVHNRKEKLTKA